MAESPRKRLIELKINDDGALDIRRPVYNGKALCNVAFSFFYENAADLGGVLYGYSFSPTPPTRQR